MHAEIAVDGAERGGGLLPRRLRLAAWGAAALVTLAPAYATPTDPAIVDVRDVVRVGVGLAGVSLLFVLLMTTPPDAIRLPKWVSRGLIAAGLGVLNAPRLARTYPDTPGWPDMPQWTAWIGWGVVHAAMAFAVWAAWVAGVRLLAKSRPRGTPWNVALFLWWPAGLLSGATLEGAAAWLVRGAHWASLAVAVMLWANTLGRAGERAWVPRTAIWLTWFAAVSATFFAAAWQALKV